MKRNENLSGRKMYRPVWLPDLEIVTRSAGDNVLVCGSSSFNLMRNFFILGTAQNGLTTATRLNTS